MTVAGLVENFFRHEYGRVVALLARRAGLQHIDLIEDAVQQALMAAIESWPRAGLPDQPSAWLFQVARNNLVEDLRQRARHARLLDEAVIAAEPVEDRDAVFLSGDVPDALLHMFFACCDASIPVESQLVLALKILCGFDTHEIALRLFTTDANVYKRFARGREKLRAVKEGPAELTAAQYRDRLPNVHRLLYLLFTEGHLSACPERAVRSEVCAEAIRLASLLATHPVGETPETFALLAMMHLHQARLPARVDGSGDLVLLEEQDRALWDVDQIRTGLVWLERSAQGAVFSRFHAEAGIAAEHCLAPSFEATRWDRIVECYALLEREAPSALHRLNRAVAMAELRGPAAGLAVLAEARPPDWLADSYLWAAVHADLHARCGDLEAATRYRQEALDRAPSVSVRTLLQRRLDR